MPAWISVLPVPTGSAFHKSAPNGVLLMELTNRVSPLATTHQIGPSYRLFASTLVLSSAILAFMPPPVWYSNEEHYLLLAYQRAAPEMFTPNSVVFLDSENHSRVLGEYLMGTGISYLGYEAGHFLLRSLMAVAYGVSLAYLFAVLGLTLSQGIIALVLYRTMEVDMKYYMMGGEWLFRGVETKTWAYAAVIAALASVVQGRWKLAATLAVLATYLHFLVGAFWSLVLLFVHFQLHRDGRKTVALGVVYAGCVAPLMIVLVWEQGYTASLRSSDGLTADYIYSFLSNAFHVAPFRKNFWESQWALRAAVTAMIMLVSAGLLRLVRSEIARTLLLSVLGICAYLLLALAASYFDRHSGTLGKFYLFRPSAFALLVFLLGVILYAQEAFATRLPRRASTVIPFLAILLLGNAYLEAIDKTDRFVKQQQKRVTRLLPVLSFASFSMTRDAVVLIDPKLDKPWLPRLLGQPTLIGRKFMPSTPEGIIKWHELMNFRKTIFRAGCVDPLKHRVDFLLVYTSEHSPSTVKKLRSCGQVVVTSKYYMLVQVEENLRWRVKEGVTLRQQNLRKF